jgi:hypothetical protein
MLHLLSIRSHDTSCKPTKFRGDVRAERYGFQPAVNKMMTSHVRRKRVPS